MVAHSAAATAELGAGTSNGRKRKQAIIDKMASEGPAVDRDRPRGR